MKNYYKVPVSYSGIVNVNVKATSPEEAQLLAQERVKSLGNSTFAQYDSKTDFGNAGEPKYEGYTHAE